ncbi:helix-turn-helix domain-containing protein [Demequina maris]|uniref:helix-turn-helix domain-containing protein n=1 Tax=Demequina maris TaxID=1638982 RepID=UPI0007821AA7|nr:helix-turn-helix domain-containing protein [Demequina maris]
MSNTTLSELAPAIPLVPDVWLTHNEAAAAMRLTPAALQTMRTRGRGPAYVRDRRRVLYRSNDLIAWIDAQPRTVPGA